MISEKTWEGTRVGFCMHSKRWCMYNTSTRRVHESQNVLFMELISCLVQSTVAGGQAFSDFGVDITGTDTLSSPGYDISSDSAGDISNGEYTTMFTLVPPPPGVVMIYISDLHSGFAVLLDMLLTLLSGLSATPVSFRGPSPGSSSAPAAGDGEGTAGGVM